MHAQIRIDMDGPDFQNEYADRIALVEALRQLIDKIDEHIKMSYYREIDIVDSKGNCIGHCKITDDASENDE